MKAFLTHPFSVMRYLCGDITHVQAFPTSPAVRKSKGDLLLSINSVHCKFASGTVGYLLSQRGDAMWGLGGWWSCEVGGSKGSFCIENCIEKLTYWPGTKPGQKTAAGAGESSILASRTSAQTFPSRIHAFLEDVTAGVHPRAPARQRPGCARDAGIHFRGHRVL